MYGLFLVSVAAAAAAAAAARIVASRRSACTTSTDGVCASWLRNASAFSAACNDGMQTFSQECSARNAGD